MTEPRFSNTYTFLHTQMLTYQSQTDENNYVFLLRKTNRWLTYDDKTNIRRKTLIVPFHSVIHYLHLQLFAFSSTYLFRQTKDSSTTARFNFFIQPIKLFLYVLGKNCLNTPCHKSVHDCSIFFC